ncbi:unnamed protein product [Sphagnum jensenii]|uniref:Uncharacterized protein n=1 Tax=Sphagnum jensenii TaxID=128206 RepID=A0ABP1ABB0_9BRYO
MICRLVIPVNVERDESVKGSTALGAADVRYAPMGVISFMPFIQLVVVGVFSWVTVLELHETNVILLDDILQDKIVDIT